MLLDVLSHCFVSVLSSIFTWKTNPLLKTKWAILAIHINNISKWWLKVLIFHISFARSEINMKSFFFCVCVNGVDSEIIWVEWAAPSRIIFKDFMLLYQSSKFLLANKVNSIDIFITVQWEFIIQLNMYYPKTIWQPGGDETHFQNCEDIAPNHPRVLKERGSSDPHLLTKS